MLTKKLSGSYPTGYYLNPTYQGLLLMPSAFVGGAGVTTTNSQTSTVTNMGTVQGTGLGISLAGGGKVINGASSPTALVEGVTAISASLAGTVVNSATIKADAVVSGSDTHIGPAIILAAGGSVSNLSPSGRIDGGIVIGGGAGVVSNGSLINGQTTAHGLAGGDRAITTGYGIQMTAGGTITNGANNNTSAVINDGVDISGGAGTITNNAIIYGTSYQFYSGATKTPDSVQIQTAIKLESGGKITNGSPSNTDASIFGAIDISGGPGTVLNFGQIVADPIAPQFDGITMGAGAVTNGSAADVTALIEGYMAIRTNDLNAATKVTNFGIIKGTDVYGVGILVGKGSTVTNGTTSDTTAQITGYYAGVRLYGGGTVTNFGTIRGSSGHHAGVHGVDVKGDGRISNGSASDTMARLIGGAYLDGAGSVANYGTIQGSIVIGSGKVMNGSAAVTTANAFAIQGLSGKVSVMNFGTASGGAFLSAGGLVANGTASDKAATLGGSVLRGVEAKIGGTTVVNFGTIAGTFASVQFDTAGSTLILEGGSVLTGKAVGAGGALQLDSKGSAGSLTGLGASSGISGFSAITVNSGGSWTLTGTNAVESTATLKNKGTLTLTGTVTDNGALFVMGPVKLGAGGKIAVGATGTLYVQQNQGISLAGASGVVLTNAGSIQSGGGANFIDGAIGNSAQIEVLSGSLNLTGNIAGTGGTLKVLKGTVLELGGSVASTQTVTFGGNGATVLLDAATKFAAAVSGFGGKISSIWPASARLRR